MARDATRRLPGNGLRAWARKVCSAATLEHVVDPIVADLQHEWLEARDRSSLAATWVRLTGYGAFARALVLHALLSGGAHLLRNAFGTTPEQRAFYRRLASTTVASLLSLTVFEILASHGLGLRSLVYVLMHQQWPGAPSEAEALRRALAIVLRADAVASVLPAAVLFVLPTSLLFGILVSRGSRSTPPRSVEPQARWIAGVALLATMFAIAIAGWVMPKTNQNYREIVFSSVTRTDRRENVPMKGSRELTFGELGNAIRSEEATNGPRLALYRTERHKRVAIPAACAVFGLIGAALAGDRRLGNTGVIALVTGSVSFVHYVLIRLGEQVLMPQGTAPFLCAWGGDLVLAAAAVLLLRRSSFRGRHHRGI